MWCGGTGTDNGIRMDGNAKDLDMIQTDGPGLKLGVSTDGVDAGDAALV